MIFASKYFVIVPYPVLLLLGVILDNNTPGVVSEYHRPFIQRTLLLLPHCLSCECSRNVAPPSLLAAFLLMLPPFFVLCLFS